MSTLSPTKSDRVARASLAGAIVAAIAASACCILPAILAIAGVSGIGLAAAIEPYRPILLVATALLLGVGFYVVYRRPRPTSAAADACGCEKPKVARTGKTMLWVVTALAIVFAAYPYIASAFTSSSMKGTATATNAATTRIQIDGMTCRSCSTSIVRALAKVDGVIEAKVEYDQAEAVVTYDPSKIEPAKLAAVIADLGYPAKVQPNG